MTDRELYQATFAHLHASGSEIRQEAKHMKQGHIRKGVVIAAAAALTVTAAGATNVATDGALLESIRVVFTGEVTETHTNPDGSTTYAVKGEDGSDIEVTIPEERNEDGSTTTQYSVEARTARPANTRSRLAKTARQQSPRTVRSPALREACRSAKA